MKAGIKTVKALPAALAAGILAATLAACAPAKAKVAVTTIQAAHTQTNVPYDFVNDKGESDGFEIAVLRAVDDLLPEYAFNFVATSDEDLLIGLESGKYNVGTKGAWSTEERRKKFIFPQNPIAASVIGITFRAQDSGRITDLDSFAAYSGKLVPISPQSAQFAVVREYNASHPDKQIALVPSDTFIINDAYAWVLEGRYDAFFDLKLSFQKNVVAEAGPYHALADKLAYVPYKGIPTWPLFSRNDQALADAYDKAFSELKASGKLAELSRKYFGEDVFLLVD